MTDEQLKTRFDEWWRRAWGNVPADTKPIEFAAFKGGHRLATAEVDHVRRALSDALDELDVVFHGYCSVCGGRRAHGEHCKRLSCKTRLWRAVAAGTK